MCIRDSPIAAITSFADPEVRFGLQFEVELPEAAQIAELPTPQSEETPAPPNDQPADVVSLDAFRRRQKD